MIFASHGPVLANPHSVHPTLCIVYPLDIGQLANAPVEYLLLLLHCHVIVQQMAAVLDKERKDDSQHTERYRGVEEDSEASGIACFECRARCSHDCGCNVRHSREGQWYTYCILDSILESKVSGLYLQRWTLPHHVLGYLHSWNQARKILGVVPSPNGRSGNVWHQVPVDDSGHDG